MKVEVVVVGRVRGDLSAPVSEYEARAARYWKLEVVEVSAGAGGDTRADAVKAAEGERILARVTPGLDLVVLSRVGRAMSSTALASLLQDAAVHASPGVAFVIGGAFGVSDEVMARATRTLSLSAMTLPHEVARLVLAEQLYRAGTIVRGEPYHKG